MKVLQVDSGREVRGGQRQLLILAEGLRRRGIDQTVLCNAAAGISTGRMLNIISPVSGFRLRKQARESDLIHAHDSHSHTLALMWAPSTPLVVSRRVSFAPGKGPASHFKYSRAAAYVAVSGHVRDALISAGVPGERIAVIHDAVKPPSEEPLFRPFGEPAKVGVLATDDPLKLQELAQAAIGHVGAEALVCRDLLRDLPAADLLLYLSESEGLGSAILAAGSLKKPVIASNIGGIPEIVAHQQTGLLCGNGIESVSAALTRFQREPELAAACAEAAYAQVIERFSDDMIVDRTREVYRSVLS